VSKFHDGGPQRLQSAYDVAISWLEGVTMKALALVNTVNDLMQE